jgi:hypothetical protein
MKEGLSLIQADPMGNIKNMLPMLRERGLTTPQEQALLEISAGVKRRTKEKELGPSQLAAGQAAGREIAARGNAPTFSPDEAQARIGGARTLADLGTLQGAFGEQAAMAGERRAERRTIRTEERALGRDLNKEERDARRKVTDDAREQETKNRQRLTELGEFETSLQVSADTANVRFRPGARARLARAEKADKTISDPVLGLPVKGGNTLLADLNLKSDVIGMLQDLEDAANEFAGTGAAGAFTGTAEEFRRQLGEGSSDPLFAKYDAIKSVQMAIEAKSRSGATMTQTEIDMIEKVFPSVNNLRFENGSLIPAARNRLDVFIKSVINSYANRLSGTYTPASLRTSLRNTTFGSNDPVALDATPVPGGER